MKKILLIAFLTNFFLTNAQTFDTMYIRGKTSTFCAEEHFSFKFDKIVFTKKDFFNGNETYGYSKVSESNYDNNGYYYEIRSADFVLNEYGVDEYKKYINYSHKLLYEKRGGELIYIFEYNSNNSIDKNNSGIDKGKYYFTKKGYEIYCK